MIEYYFVEDSIKYPQKISACNGVDTREKTHVHSGQQCKTYILSVFYNGIWYESHLTKYDFTSLYIKIKSLPKILDKIEIAQNIKSDYYIDENFLEKKIRLTIDLTITKVNKRVFETIELSLDKVDEPHSVKFAACRQNDNSSETYNPLCKDKITGQHQDKIPGQNETSQDEMQKQPQENNNIHQYFLVTEQLEQVHNEYKGLMTKNYELNSRYCYEVGFQQGFINSQDIVTKKLSSEMTKMKQESEQISFMNEIYTFNLPSMINWRESIEKYKNSLYLESGSSSCDH